MAGDPWIRDLQRWDPGGVDRPWLDPLSPQRSWDQTPTAQILLRALEERLGPGKVFPVAKDLLRQIPAHDEYNDIRAKLLQPTALNLEELHRALSWAARDDDTAHTWGPRCVLQALLGMDYWRLAYYAERFVEGHNLSYVVRRRFPVERFTG